MARAVTSPRRRNPRMPQPLTPACLARYCHHRPSAPRCRWSGPECVACPGRRAAGAKQRLRPGLRSTPLNGVYCDPTTVLERSPSRAPANPVNRIGVSRLRYVALPRRSGVSCPTQGAPSRQVGEIASVRRGTGVTEFVLGIRDVRARRDSPRPGAVPFSRLYWRLFEHSFDLCGPGSSIAAADGVAIRRRLATLTP